MHFPGSSALSLCHLGISIIGPKWDQIRRTYEFGIMCGSDYRTMADNICIQLYLALIYDGINPYMLKLYAIVL